MNSIAPSACELLERGETFVLATIVSHTGSTPRTSGSRMIVTADGGGIDTIGGGMLEARAMSRAVELIAQGRSAVMPFDLSHANVDSMDMICGGQADVLLDCVAPTAVNLAVFNRWRQMLAQRQSACLLTLVSASGNVVERIDHCLVMSDGEIVGDLPLDAGRREKILAQAVDVGEAHTLTIEDGFVVLEPTRPRGTLYLMGAGHVAQSTAAMAAMVDFRVSVADDREEYANHERFPDSQEVRVLDTFERAFSGLVVARQDLIVILTRGHLHDKTVLAQALTTDAGYVGMIGSRRKRSLIYGALLKEGFTQEQIDRVYSPIGLSIGAETPEEIAVSILAQLVQHRAQAEG